MNGDNVGKVHQLFERDLLDPEHRSLLLADEGIMKKHFEIKRLQKIDDTSADPGGSDDANGAPKVSDRLAAQRKRPGAVSVGTIDVPEAEHLLVGEDDGSKRELGYRNGIGFSRMGNQDVMDENIRRQEALHGTCSMRNKLQPWCVRQGFAV